MVHINSKFDEIIQTHIKKLQEESKNAKLYKVGIEKTTSPEDFIFKLKTASDINEYRLKYSLEKDNIIQNSKELMKDSTIHRYKYRNPLDTDKVDILVEDVCKIVSDELGDVEITNWTLENKKSGNTWKIKYLDSSKKADSIKISASDGSIIS